MSACVGVFGGTFDPVHRGHLQIALDFLQHLPLTQLRLLPCAEPPHRQQPGASAEQRLAMLELALAQLNNNDVVIDARELQRQGPSYSIDTLVAIRAELGEQASLVLCMGSDVFSELPSWHRWQELLSLAHIAVAARAGQALVLNDPVKKLLAEQQVHDAAVLQQQPAGYIVYLQMAQVPLSSSAVRAGLHAGNLPEDALPLPVWQYIKQHALYGA